MTIDIAEGKRLLAKATQGPWVAWNRDPRVITNADGSSLGEMKPGDPFISHNEAVANAALIVWLRNNAAAILSAAPTEALPE